MLSVQERENVLNITPIIRLGDDVKYNKISIAVYSLILISFLIGAYFYPGLPEQMAIHWNAQGEADGYVNKLVGVFFAPVIMVILAIFLGVAPMLDPLKENIMKIKDQYTKFILVLFFYILLIHINLIAWSMGYRIQPVITMAVGFGMLLFYIGHLFERVEQNWTIGIRTPWTMKSETVWEETHKLGARLFKVAGIISVLGGVASLFGFISPEYTLILLIGPIVLFAIYLIGYSYVKGMGEQKGKKKRSK